MREIEEGILVNGRKLQRKTVRRKCDNWATRKIVKLGSMKEDCHIVAIRIEEPCRKWKNKLDSFWISRESEQIEYCNMVSKKVDTSDFASERSWRRKPFYAKFGCRESEGINAFVPIRVFLGVLNLFLNSCKSKRIKLLWSKPSCYPLKLLARVRVDLNQKVPKKAHPGDPRVRVKVKTLRASQKAEPRSLWQLLDRRRRTKLRTRPSPKRYVSLILIYS